MKHQLSHNTTAQQVQSIQAVVHRLQRVHEGEALRPGEFTDVIRCSDDACEAMKHGEECSHPKVIGVYRAIPLGTVVGGNIFRKVESYLRIKLANFVHGHSSN